MKMLSLKMIKESGRRKLFVIPYFFTFANASFGFFSVIQTFEGNFSAAAFLILLAVLMDFLDGRLARAFDSSSSLGMELDSLSDAVSFCFAPAVLLYSSYLSGTGLFGVAVLTAYLCAGLLRLAKFNVLSADEETKSFFVGLPTTSAAFFLVLLVLRGQWVGASFLRFLLAPNFLLFLVLFIAFLMISPVRFPSFKRVDIFSRPFNFLLVSGGLISLVLLLKGVPIFLFGLLAYILGGILFSSLTGFRFFVRK